LAAIAYPVVTLVGSAICHHAVPEFVRAVLSQI
jgi:hypothetical protein